MTASLSIFIFRRDLRLHDNIGLLLALSESAYVLPIFIFTPEQISRNIYKSNNCIQFMIESLMDLDISLKKRGSKLHYFYGNVEQVLKSIMEKIDISGIYVNKDFTPYSKERDLKIENLCQKYGIKFSSSDDCTLYSIGFIKTVQNKTYTKFTPFLNEALTHTKKINKPLKNTYKNFYKINFLPEFTKINDLYIENKHIAVKGGRDNGLLILKNIHEFNNYNKNRNMLAIPTTRLSAYNKFGCVSIREVYYAIKNELGSKNDLLKQLFWREFYYNIMNDNPSVISEHKNLKQSFESVKWATFDNASRKHKLLKMFKYWCKGITGYPIVDACMRELNTTGYMHNRGRLIVASFLIHNLGISWIEGERYFATKLVDIDPSQNNGNWQWVSGAGVQTVPYSRLIFNPWRQSEKYDPDCIYIKYWVPELSAVKPEHIHHWDTHYDKYPNIKYNKPIIDFELTRLASIQKYRKSV